MEARKNVDWIRIGQTYTFIYIYIYRYYCPMIMSATRSSTMSKRIEIAAKYSNTRQLTNNNNNNNT